MNTIASLARSLPHRTLSHANGEMLEYSLKKCLLCLIRKQARWCYSAATIFDYIYLAPKILLKYWDRILNSRQSQENPQKAMSQSNHKFLKDLLVDSVYLCLCVGMCI